jgi:hypothetical protein
MTGIVFAVSLLDDRLYVCYVCYVCVSVYVYVYVYVYVCV